MRLLYAIILILASSNILAEEVPLGIAHNNPGNISGSVNSGWAGQIPCSDSRTEPDGTYNICFKNWKWGVRAMMKNLMTYHTKHGVNTIEGIVDRWAVKHKSQYAKYVAAQMGIDVDTPFELNTNPVFMTFLVEAMIRWEQGWTKCDKCFIYDFDMIYAIAIFTDWTAK